MRSAEGGMESSRRDAWYHAAENTRRSVSTYRRKATDPIQRTSCVDIYYRNLLLLSMIYRLRDMIYGYRRMIYFCCAKI